MKKALSVILVLILLTMTMPVGFIVSAAETGHKGDIVYFDNSVTKYSEVYIFLWNEGGGMSWPGVKMTDMGNNVWSYVLEADWDNLIFSQGNSSGQSEDLKFVGNNKIAVAKSNSNLFNVSWSDYSGTHPQQTPSLQIPNDAIHYMGHYYKLFKNLYDTWEEAEKYCESLGGHLATISSAQEDRFAYDNLVRNGAETAYIGFTDSNQEGVWEWVTGEPIVYTNWYPGEPNDSLGEDYASYYYKFTNGQWNDGNFGHGTDNDKQYFLCEWDEYSASWGQVSRKSSLLSNTRLNVYQNNGSEYKTAQNAKIEYNGQEYMTDVFGTASMPTVDSGSVTVSKSGFITRTLTAEQLKVSKNIYLEPTNDNAPVVTAVWIENTDVLHDSYPLPMTSKEKTTIKAEVDWGKYSYGSIKLWQDGKAADFSNDTLSMVISSQFDTSGTITLIATDSENRKTEKTLLIENSTVNQMLKKLDGISFDFNDSINLTLPDSIPLIGGTKVGAGLSSAVPISISADKGKVYVSIGAQLFHGETKGEKGKAAESKKIIGFINNFKETFKDNKDAVSKLKKFKNTFKNDLAKPKGKFGVEADFTLIGFAEGTFDENGKVTWVDTGLILNPSVSISKDFPFAIGPIPLYFEVGLSAEALAQLNIRLNEQAKNFVPNGEISGKVALNGGVGIGVKKVLYAGGGLEGSLNPDWKININKQDYFTLKAKLSAYAKAGILIFEGKKTWDLAEKTLIEYPSKKSGNSVGALLDDYNFYDYSNYTVKDLSYLNSASNKSKAGEAVGANAGDSVGITQLKSNIYRESTPQLVVFDNGTKLAVWTDGESSDINGVCLYYSFFNGSSWSAPAKVQNDGTMDYAPQMIESNGKAYLVWQNATKAFDANNDLSLETIAKDFDISVAVFDDSSFTTTTLQNDNLDMQPVVCADGDNAYIAWINNSSNDWFGNNTNNSIFVSRFENNVWSQTEALYSGLNSVDSLAIDYNNGVKVAYSLDTDGDINTTDDLHVYENGTLVSSNEQSAGNPQYCGHKLYWYTDNCILSSDIEATEAGVITSDRYQLINVDGNLAAVFTEADGLYSRVSVSYFNTETGIWNTPKVLADNHSAIGAFGADTDENGNIQLLINNCAVVGSYDDEEPYGTSDLVLFENSDYCDIAISEALFNEENFCVNEPMLFDFDITNNGSGIIKGLDVIIADKNETVLNTVYIEDLIVPGETIAASAFYVPDEKFVSQDVKITAIPRNSTDRDMTNNSHTVTLSYENLSVENLTSAEMENGKIVISADIINYGYQNSDAINVKLLRDSIEGQVVETKTINAINSLDMQTVSFEINDNTRRNYFVCIDGETDGYSADNSNYILINRENQIGDTNLDGNININDVTAIQRHLADIELLTDEQIALADTNGDGNVDITDATHLQKYLAEYYGIVLGKS